MGWRWLSARASVTCGQPIGESSESLLTCGRSRGYSLLGIGFGGVVQVFVDLEVLLVAAWGLRRVWSVRLQLRISSINHRPILATTSDFLDVTSSELPSSGGREDMLCALEVRPSGPSPHSAVSFLAGSQLQHRSCFWPRLNECGSFSPSDIDRALYVYVVDP